MNKLLTAALLLALSGAARAESAEGSARAEGAAAPPAAGSGKSGKARVERRAGTKDKKRKETRPKQTDRAATPPAGTSGAKPAEKPCEPVKPCPID